MMIWKEDMIWKGKRRKSLSRIDIERHDLLPRCPTTWEESRKTWDVERLEEKIGRHGKDLDRYEIFNDMGRISKDMRRTWDAERLEEKMGRHEGNLDRRGMSKGISKISTRWADMREISKGISPSRSHVWDIEDLDRRGYPLRDFPHVCPSCRDFRYPTSTDVGYRIQRHGKKIGRHEKDLTCCWDIDRHEKKIEWHEKDMRCRKTGANGRQTWERSRQIWDIEVMISKSCVRTWKDVFLMSFDILPMSFDTQISTDMGYGRDERESRRGRKRWKRVISLSWWKRVETSFYIAWDMVFFACLAMRRHGIWKDMRRHGKNIERHEKDMRKTWLVAEISKDIQRMSLDMRRIWDMRSRKTRDNHRQTWQR